MTTDLRMWSRWNQSLEKWRSAKGQWCWSTPRRFVVNAQCSPPSLFCQPIEMKTLWVHGWISGKWRCGVKAKYKIVLKLSFESPSRLTNSTCELQELDLRDAQHNFWNFWVGTEDGVCAPDVISETRPVVHGPRRGEDQVVTVWMNLSLETSHLSKYLKYFFWWAKQRKDVVQVMCPKLEFGATPLYNPLMLLEVFEPSSIEEFAVNARWNLRTLVMIAPGLGQMKNLQKILLNGIFTPLECLVNREMREWYFTQIISQVSELKKIQHLQLNDVCFLNERLGQVLR